MKYDHIPEFNNSHALLKETSWDSKNGVALSDSTEVVYNFDNVKNEYFKKYYNCYRESAIPAKSVDALLINNDKNVFIEFKNREVEHNEIRIKISDTLLVFNDLTQSQLSDRCKDSVYILVYSAEKNKKAKPVSKSYNDIVDEVGALAGEETIHFRLAKHRGTFFKEFHTYNEKEFEGYLLKQGLATK